MDRANIGPRASGPWKTIARTTALAAVVALGGHAAYAQSPAPAVPPAIPKVEFDDAIQRAIANNPQVAEAQNAIARARTLLSTARAQLGPTMSAGVSNATLNAARGFSAGVVQPRNQTTLSFDATMPIINLSNWAALPQARDQIDVATRSATDVKRATAVAAADAYLAVITAQREVDIESQAVNNARAHEDYAQKLLAGGAGSRLNEVRAAGSLAGEQTRLENARLVLTRSQEALGVLLASDGPVNAGDPPALTPPPPGSEDQWMAARPDVQVATANRDAAQHLVGDSWRRWVGTASVSFDPQYITPSTLFQPSGSWRLTASFTQPLFSRQIAAERAPLEVSLERTKLVLTAVEIQARSEVRVAEAALQSDTRALARARDASAQADEALRITSSAFQLGATTNIEVIDAQQAARDADIQAALADDALQRAKLDVLVAIGQFPK